MRLAQRIAQLPPYLFAEIDRAKKEVRARGVDLIDLGIGDPDTPTFPHIVRKMQEAAENPAYHRYPSYEGLPAFRQSVARWYRSRFGVALDPDTEVVSLIGSKEGIAHISLAFTDPGDVNLVPSPGYPVYNIGTLFAGGTPYFLPLTRESGFLPDLDAIPNDVAKRAKLLFLNYPNNPTAAVAGREFYERVVAFARRHNVIVCHDAAYSEIYFGGPPMSFLEVDGAKDVGIEFHSLSKTYNMTGWRIGFAVGNAGVIGGLGKIKTNVDSGLFEAIQIAGIEALEGDQAPQAALREMYRARRDVLIGGLRSAGFDVVAPEATFYVWIPVPAPHTSSAFAKLLLEKVGVVATPGNGFGEAGEGYVRMTLCLPEGRLQEAVERIRGAKLF
ncbi:MAG: LL-diaminopimelate aminotransferase [Deltaproteobacteria bacterium]|nr:LL-diaminopimelate aminotransferase [Deltaproteobacteria bacterium]